MHELSITRNIVAIVSEKAADRTVRRIHLQVGRLSGVEVQAIRFCYPLCTEGTALADTELVIEEVEGRASCDGCGEQLAIQQPVAVCPCERRASLRILAGEELLIKSMEV